ncbi:hypothetical protein [Actinomycetospora termitidis]|uniref:DUF559 domain-containing protein n=1 Tax=Actinomycetospora termitidis TaxID=3053470 RepID=A0ABT7M2J6_9PSEU|nr:hypothetical protein [Actinomycetospora sp. Odt1-22]MDL5154878.1 hypothetical protein [Actinomycetospora sp. Odt1-22]
MSDAAPSNLILVRTLLALGVPSSTIAFRCRKAGGMWWHPLQGLVALVRGVLTVHQRLVAALLVAGDEAMVTGLAACRLYGLDRVPDHDQVHVLIPHEQRRRSEGFLLVERTSRLPPNPVVRDGIRCAPLVRALVDAARRLMRIDEVRALLCEAVQRRMVTVVALRAELEAGSGRGAALVRQVVVELEDGIRSAAEGWLREMVRAMPEFTAIRWNVALRLPNGQKFVADGFLDGVALAIELHSFAHHADLATFDATMRRQAEMIAAGIVVVPVTPRELRDDPAAVRRKLRDALEQARLRPRPAVVVI